MSDSELQNRFESLLAPILAAAYRAALQMTRDRDDAEDLVQEAALQAFRAFHTFREGTNFRAWFFKILTNLFYYGHRKKQREPEIAPFEDAAELYLYSRSFDAGLHAQRADPAAVVMGRLDERDVTDAIARLPEEYRVVTALYFVDQFSYQEIAEVLDCPVGTVRSRLHRGRRLLQKALWRVAADYGVTAGPAGEGD
jgi:RNA polymerase sigma-70 factor, ECF subfamily